LTLAPKINNRFGINRLRRFRLWNRRSLRSGTNLNIKRTLRRRQKRKGCKSNGNLKASLTSAFEWQISWQPALAVSQASGKRKYVDKDSKLFWADKKTQKDEI
jgi:hypothetical protein